MEAAKFEYWLEGIIMAVFQNFKPEWKKSGITSIPMAEAISQIKKKPEDKAYWDSLSTGDQFDAIYNAFRRMSRKQYRYIQEGDKEIKVEIPKQLQRTGKYKGESKYGPVRPRDKVTHMQPSPVVMPTKIG